MSVSSGDSASQASRGAWDKGNASDISIVTTFYGAPAGAVGGKAAALLHEARLGVTEHGAAHFSASD
jgi:hypothetical protein